MLMSRIVPIFFFAPAISAMRDGEIGQGIACLAISAAFIIVMAVFDDIQEREREKRER